MPCKKQQQCAGGASTCGYEAHDPTDERKYAMHPLRPLITLIEAYAITASGQLVYHGSKTRRIEQFEYRHGTRSAWFDIKHVQANGFFFALTPEEAREHGPYVSAYHIQTNRPLVFGHDGVDPVRDLQRKADIQYILSAALDPLANGDFEFAGLTHDIYVRASAVSNIASDWIYEFMGPGGLDWEVLDVPEVVKRMRERGYDSTVVYEKHLRNHISWFVLDPQQIQFVAEIA